MTNSSSESKDLDSYTGDKEDSFKLHCEGVNSE